MSSFIEIISQEIKGKWPKSAIMPLHHSFRPEIKPVREFLISPSQALGLYASEFDNDKWILISKFSEKSLFKYETEAVYSNNLLLTQFLGGRQIRLFEIDSRSNNDLYEVGFEIPYDKDYKGTIPTQVKSTTLKSLLDFIESELNEQPLESSTDESK